MKILKHFIINIVLSAAILYFVANYVPELGLRIDSEYKDVFAVFGILGVFFWIVNSLLRYILEILTLPAKYLTLGLSSLIVNRILFYIFEQSVNYLDVGITVQLWSIVQTLMLSIIITSLYFIIKKLI